VRFVGAAGVHVIPLSGAVLEDGDLRRFDGAHPAGVLPRRNHNEGIVGDAAVRDLQAERFKVVPIQ